MSILYPTTHNHFRRVALAVHHRGPPRRWDSVDKRVSTFHHSCLILCNACSSRGLSTILGCNASLRTNTHLLLLPSFSSDARCSTDTDWPYTALRNPHGIRPGQFTYRPTDSSTSIPATRARGPLLWTFHMSSRQTTGLASSAARPK